MECQCQKNGAIFIIHANRVWRVKVIFFITFILFDYLIGNSKPYFRDTSCIKMSLSNVEIKAKIRNLDNICKLAEQLSGGPPTLLEQDDTFYKASAGRLKMRFNGDSSATLVRYDRDDKEGPKQSKYELLEFSPAEIDKAKLLDEMLVKSIGKRGRVVKKRKLYMVGQTRVHIDCVEGLGDFMELEVVMRPEQRIEDGQKIATELQMKLGVQNEDLIECAYVDMF